MVRPHETRRSATSNHTQANLVRWQAAPQIPLALATPSLNRGVAFTHEERRRLGLTGRLPSGVLTLEAQAERVRYELTIPTSLGRNLLLDQLHNRHEVLYFKVLSEHLPS